MEAPDATRWIDKSGCECQKTSDGSQNDHDIMIGLGNAESLGSRP